MEFITTKEAAEKWEMSEQAVRRFCRNGKIPGAIQDGSIWLVPEKARRPRKSESVGVDTSRLHPLARRLVKQKTKKIYLSEMRLATPVGVFSVQRPKKWPSNINSLEKIREAYYDIDKHIGGDYMARAFRGEMSLLDADNQSQRAVIEEMCRRYKIPFRFDTWDDIRKE